MLFPILSRCLSLFAVALLSAMWANPAHAWSTAQLTLQELIDGETFNSRNGLLFSDFDAVFSGDLADQIDASDIRVVAVDVGFLLAGPLSAADGEIGDIALSYSVATESGLAEIIGASLFSVGVAFGSGARAAVDEMLLADGELVGALSAWDTGAVRGDALFFHETVFGDPLQEILVLKDILVDGTTPLGWGSARISRIEQRFVTEQIPTPEPATLGLLGIGLGGLTVLGRRRAR